MKRALVKALLGVAVTAFARPAFAVPPAIESALARTEAASPPRAPAPFVLPDLAHHSVDFAIDLSVGRFTADSDFVKGERAHTYAGLGRFAMEANILMPRRFFVGWSFPFGLSVPPDGGLAPEETTRPAGARRFTGNIEGHIRTVFPLPTWLEIGFVGGIMFPTTVASRDYRPNIAAARHIASLDPTSYPDFLPGRIGLRPAGDLRIRRGPLIFQGRHGIDVLFDSQGLSKTTVAARLLAHIGYLARPDLEVAVEASQFYSFASTNPPTSGTPGERVFAETYRVKDGSRSAITLGPTLRAMTEFYDYGFAMVTNLADPLSPVADGFIGFRFSIIAHVNK